MPNNIAIIAGSGSLPSLVLNCISKNAHKKVCVLAIKDNAEVSLFHNIDCAVIHLGQVEKAIRFLREHFVTEILLAGGIKKPSLLSMKIDKKGLLCLGKLGLKVLSGGDDKLLKVVIDLFEAEGFKVVSVQDVAPSLLASKGVIGKYSPSKPDLQDIEIGNNVLLRMGDLDIGQSVIVENEVVLGVEAAEGTDKLIERCSVLKKEKQGVGVLVKRKKTHQDIRVDLPTIGINTIELAYRSGFKGIAIGANESLILDKESVINLANKYKLFLVGI
ncbi:MAG: UDP-2,3-diacylglucosamine diphosphatase LpxI [Rickettsiales bacterium]|nr:UDP-2,3-diacylglucosamine diphosphatase LpxI [Rickettsiales bacterium]